MADEKEKNGEKEKSGGKKDLLILILVVFNMLTMLGVVGIVVYTYLNQPQKETIVDVVTDEKRVDDPRYPMELDCLKLRGTTHRHPSKFNR